MKLWPFGRIEKRTVQGGGSQGGAGFTDAIVQALLNQAAGGTTADPSATAALEAAAGQYARAFAVAEVTPATPATRALTPAPAAAVIHARYSVDPARPWFGISPLGWARLTGRLHASLEDAIADEASGTRGHVLPVPAGPDADGTGDPNAVLRADIEALRGRTVMVETTAAGWGEGMNAAPRSDWKPSRIGANPPASMATLRTDSAQAVLAACGVSADLFVAGDAAGQRESWRRFLHGSVQPLGDLVAAELAVKLDVPGLRLNFDRLMASDLSGRARALGSMVTAGMELDEARRLAGLS